MPVSEKSFADRLGRGRLMQAAIAVFDPPFVPAEASLEEAAFETFLDTLDTLNTETANLVTQYSNGVDEREVLVTDIKARVLRVLSFVESNAAWKKYARGIKTLADKIRGNRPRKPKPPAPSETPGSPPAKARNKGEQSFAEIEENFEQLIAAVQGITGYTPPATAITVASLQTLSTNFSTKNSDMAALGRQVVLKQGERLDAYDGEGGLREKMLAIKKAVRAQYGSSSTEYDAVKSIKV